MTLTPIDEMIQGIYKKNILLKYSKRIMTRKYILWGHYFIIHYADTCSACIYTYNEIHQ